MTFTSIEVLSLCSIVANICIISKNFASEITNRLTQRNGEAVNNGYTGSVAKSKGKYKGGKPKYKENDPRLQLAFKLYLAGATDKEVEQQTGINRRTFRRYRQKYGVIRVEKEKRPTQ